MRSVSLIFAVIILLLLLPVFYKDRKIDTLEKQFPCSVKKQGILYLIYYSIIEILDVIERIGIKLYSMLGVNMSYIVLPDGNKVTTQKVNVSGSRPKTQADELYNARRRMKREITRLNKDLQNQNLSQVQRDSMLEYKKNLEDKVSNSYIKGKAKSKNEIQSTINDLSKTTKPAMTKSDRVEQAFTYTMRTAQQQGKVGTNQDLKVNFFMMATKDAWAGKGKATDRYNNIVKEAQSKDKNMDSIFKVWDAFWKDSDVQSAFGKSIAIRTVNDMKKSGVTMSRNEAKNQLISSISMYLPMSVADDIAEDILSASWSDEDNSWFDSDDQTQSDVYELMPVLNLMQKLRGK